jgi:hypothetical protein
VTPRARLSAIKAVHTLVWFAVESSVVYLLVTGFARHTDRSVAVTGGIVAGETLIFAANGFRCPLTTVAESLGADSGSVTDIYLPRWFAKSLPAIHVPLVGLIVALHVRNVRERT